MLKGLSVEFISLLVTIIVVTIIVLLVMIIVESILLVLVIIVVSDERGLSSVSSKLTKEEEIQQGMSMIDEAAMKKMVWLIVVRVRIGSKDDSK